MMCNVLTVCGCACLVCLLVCAVRSLCNVSLLHCEQLRALEGVVCVLLGCVFLCCVGVLRCAPV